MHAKFGRRREHARGAPNRINHIPAADSVNVISDQHRKWMNKTEKVFPFCSSKPEVQQTSIRPYLVYFATYQYFLGIALFILAIDPSWAVHAVRSGLTC